MREMTHIYTGPCACGCVVDGERYMVTPGEKVPFGPADIDPRARERLGEFFLPLDGSGGSFDEFIDEDPATTGPEWAQLTVAELCELADGFAAFSKSGLETLCEVADIDPTGSVSDLRARLFDNLEANTAEADEDEPEFSSLEDIDKMDPEFGLGPEDD